MADQKHVQPSRRSEGDDLAFVDSKDFHADPTFYLEWVCDNRCDLAVRDEAGLVVGLMVSDPTPVRTFKDKKSGVQTIAIDKETFAENVADVVEILRSGKVNGQMRIKDSRRDATLHLYSEGQSVLSNALWVNYALPLTDLIDIVRKERARQERNPISKGIPLVKKSPPDFEENDGGGSSWEQDDPFINVKTRLVRGLPVAGDIAGKMVIRTLRVVSMKVAVPTVKYAYETWLERDRGVVRKVVGDVKEQWRQLFGSGFGF